MLEQPSNFIPKGRLKEFSGDLSIPESAGNRFVLVLVSDEKKDTDGGSVYSRWGAAEREYKIWYNNSFGKMNEWLGQIKTVQVQSDTTVANLLCKHGTKIDYEALEKCLDAVGKEAANASGTIHMNKIGTGKNWKKVQGMIEELLLKRGLNVNVYG